MLGTTQDDSTRPAAGRTEAVTDLAREFVRMRKAMESMRARFAAMHGIGVDRGALTVLFAVVARGPQRPGDLARDLNLDASTLTRHVKALLQAGHVQQVPDPQDRRARLVDVTDLGRQTHQRVVEARDHFMAHLVRDWQTPDIVNVARLLTRLNDAADTYCVRPAEADAPTRLQPSKESA